MLLSPLSGFFNSLLKKGVNERSERRALGEHDQHADQYEYDHNG